MIKIQNIVADELGLQGRVKSDKIHTDSKSFKAIKQEQEGKAIKFKKTENALMETLYNSEEGEKKLSLNRT